MCSILILEMASPSAEINVIPYEILLLRYVLPQSDDIIDVHAINAKFIS